MIDFEPELADRWIGACAIIDHGAKGPQHVTCVNAVHCLRGYRLPCLPGSGIDFVRAPHGERCHGKNRLLAELLSSLHEPVYFLHARTELPPVCIPTIEIRLVRHPKTAADPAVEAYLLAKVAVPILPGYSHDELCILAEDRLDLLHARFAVACSDGLGWEPPPLPAVSTGREPLHAILAAADRCPCLGEVRRENLWPLMSPPPSIAFPADYADLLQHMTDAGLPRGFLPWPIQPTSLSFAREMIRRQSRAAVVALRFQPVYLSSSERAGLQQLTQSLTDAAVSFPSPANAAFLEAARLLLQRLAGNCRLFATSVDVATETPAWLDALLNQLSGGIHYSRSRQSHSPATTTRRPAWEEEAATLAPIRSTRGESGLCRYNLKHLEFLSWGGIWEDPIPDYWDSDHCPNDLPPKPVISNEEKVQLAHLLPALAARDIIPQAELSRLRKILTFEEAVQVWTGCF